MIIFRKFLRKTISKELLNSSLQKKKFEKTKKLNFPFISLVGPPRSGTTFFYNFILKNFDLDYVSNIEYLFYKYPFFSIKIGKYLKKIFHINKNYNSKYGFSSGLTSPSENSLFWEDFVGFRDFKSSIESKKLNLNTLRYIFNYRYKNNKKPVINKWTPLIFYKKNLDQIFQNNKYIGIIRNPYQTANSILLARKKINNSKNEWWSFAPTGSQKYSNPYDQISFQVCSYLLKMKALERNGEIEIFSYEEIIRNPKLTLQRLRQYIGHMNINEKKQESIILDKNFLKPKKISNNLFNSLNYMIKKNKLNKFLKKYISYKI